MSYYLIGIGGTGSRCLEAFIHLNGAGLLKDNQPVNILYVDADVSNGNLQRTQKTADLYNKCEKLEYGAAEVFRNKIETLEPWTPIPENCNNLDQVFSRASMETKTEFKSLGLLYDTLFTEKERKTTLDKGFRGHPCIGAAVMSQTIDVENTEPWKKLKDQLSQDKDPRIFLFASVFGGTGAAGFPTIAKLVHDALKKDENGKSIAKIGGALVLPYFQFFDTEESDTMRAKVEEFMINTQSALKYYDESGILGSIFNSIYMIGDNDLTEVKNFSIGANTQTNEAHFIEMYAALAAFDFFNKENFDKNETPMIARGDKNNVSWEDLPEASLGLSFKEKWGNYIKFLYIYRNYILPYLENIALHEKNENPITWYKDLVKKAGRTNVYQDAKAMDKFRALGEYAGYLFEWLKDVQTNNKRSVQLISKNACATNFIEEYIPLDVYQIVLPVTERKDKLTRKETWQQLCDFEVKNSNASGTGYLMEAIYSVCSKQ